MNLETLKKAKEIEYEIDRITKIIQNLSTPGNSVDVFDAKAIMKRPEFRELLSKILDNLKKEMSEL